VIVNFLAIAVDCSSAAVQPRSAEGERERLLAMCHPSQATWLATSAGQECEHHGIAGRDFDNISTDEDEDEIGHAEHDCRRAENERCTKRDVREVEEGATVKSGELIALSGSSGRVTGPHLHWGARLANARIDPLELLTRISVNSENAGGSKSVVKQMEK